MSREICNECLGKQKRDGKLSKEARERLVHRWRLFPGAAEHFRRDCRWWPRDGTPFHQRGIDFRSRIGEAGAVSQVAVLGGIASGLTVWFWVPVVLLLQTSVNVDVALVLTALTPLVVAVGAIIQVFAARKAAAIATETKEIARETHVLVNDQMTREKENRLFEMQLSRVTLSRLVHDSAQPEEQEALTTLDKRIAALEAEIANRDAIAATLPSAATVLKP